MSRRGEPELALAFGPEPWVEDLHRFCTDHGGARVTHLLLDPATATEERFDALVASHRWPGLTRGLVEALHGRGVAVIGVHDGSEAACALLEACGCDLLLDGSAPPDTMVADIRARLETRPERPVPAPAPAGTAGTGTGTPEAPEAPLVCVAGPGGAGATEVAIALARAWARRGARTVLVDADPHRCALAARLALPREPNLGNLVDATEHGDGVALDACTPVQPGLTVVAGSARLSGPGASPGPAGPVGPGSAEVGRAIGVLQRTHDVVVVDAGSLLPLGGPPAHPADPPSGRMLVAVADVVVAVGHGTPAGVVALAGWLAEARGIAPGPPVHVVVNRAPRGRHRRAALAAEVDALGVAASIHVVGPDRAVMAAAWAGTPVQRGGWSRRIDRCAERVVTVTRARGGARGRGTALPERAAQRGRRDGGGVMGAA